MSETALRAMRTVLRLAAAAVAVIVVVIGLGVLLQLLDANPEAGFTEWAYDNQDAVMTPFEGVFEPVELGQEGNVVDVSGLFAMAVYACGLIPVGLGLGWVRRRLERLDARRAEEVDRARHARIFGEVPVEPAGPAEGGPASRRGTRARLHGTDRGPRGRAPADGPG